ncbi:MAG: hypothetical protein ACP5G0_07415 [Desulfomonilia bacterium]
MLRNNAEIRMIAICTLLGFILCVLFVSCTSEGGSSGSIDGVSLVIGSEGGDLEVTDPSSSISGARVHVPRSALSGNQEIRLEENDPPDVVPVWFRAAGQCVRFQPDGIQFATPVQLFLPYRDVNSDGIVDGLSVSENLVRVLYFNELSGIWEECPVMMRDREENRVMITSSHFSTYLAAIDTSDMDTVSVDIPDGYTLASGDCFIGYDQECPFYFMTITRRDGNLLAVIDRNATYSTGGYHAVISEGGDSAAFDVLSAFEKVRFSGDATLWEWECEFDQYHTFLRDYEVREDSLVTEVSDTESSEERIHCQIAAEDSMTGRITWQIDAEEQVLFETNPVGNGHMLVVKFRATFR